MLSVQRAGAHASMLRSFVSVPRFEHYSLIEHNAEIQEDSIGMAFHRQAVQQTAGLLGQSGVHQADIATAVEHFDLVRQALPDIARNSSGNITVTQEDKNGNLQFNLGRRFAVRDFDRRRHSRDGRRADKIIARRDIVDRTFHAERVAEALYLRRYSLAHVNVSNRLGAYARGLRAILDVPAGHEPVLFRAALLHANPQRAVTSKNPLDTQPIIRLSSPSAAYLPVMSRLVVQLARLQPLTFSITKVPRQYYGHPQPPERTSFTVATGSRIEQEQ